jgi:hypothetical protein
MPPTPCSTAPVFRSKSRNVYQEAHTFLGGYLILLISSKGHSVNLNNRHKPDQIRRLSSASCAAHFSFTPLPPLLPDSAMVYPTPSRSHIPSTTIDCPIDLFHGMFVGCLNGVFFTPWASLYTACSVFSHRNRQSRSH